MQKTTARRWLIVTTLLFAVGGVLGVIPALFSPMMFDAPGSTENPFTVALFLSVISFPVVSLLSIVISWLLYAFDRPRAAWLLALTPLIPIFVGALALTGLQLLHGGSFSG